MALEIILMLVWLHFISDFILDIDLVMKKRDRVNKNVITHSFFYSVPFILIGPLFALVTFVGHTVVDFLESSLKKKVGKSTDIEEYQGKYLNYVIIGVDQLTHLTILIFTYHLLDKFGSM